MSKKSAFSVIIGLILVLAILVIYRQFFESPKPQDNQANNNNTQQPPKPALKICTGGNDILKGGVDDTLGAYFTDGECRTLYVSSLDANKISSCDAVCTQTWIPYQPDPTYNLAAATDEFSLSMSIHTRGDGTAQYVFREKPLYYYSGDLKPGDINGIGVDPSWSILPIKGALN